MYFFSRKLQQPTFPTDGKPINAIRASPDFNTSNPSPFSPFFDGSSNCDRYFASLALRRPKWYSVAAKTIDNYNLDLQVRIVLSSVDTPTVRLNAMLLPLFFCVLAISFSISEIFSRIPILEEFFFAIKFFKIKKTIETQQKE